MLRIMAGQSCTWGLLGPPMKASCCRHHHDINEVSRQLEKPTTATISLNWWYSTHLGVWHSALRMLHHLRHLASTSHVIKFC
jgi:hypothetical protein